jgi:hypothetical protein
MRLPAQVSGLSAALTVAYVMSVAAWAGGAGFGDDNDTSAETGPSYFGFVRDANGATVPGATVTVAVKNHGSVITRTDALGTYKVPGFGTDVNPKDVEISCDKQGYKQARVVRRSSPSTDPKIPIETECILQPI